ncbi:LasR-specific antiactivator QslA [Phytopseudomonas daroniae]|uniref:LasR-specific antiactivator QslA n=1 Tax=Phytopseudomonas daroniae TaxID=2487519 RepID=UPI001038495F|nr:LasR-specific antiactivator QslA [Pseudomonas daroniae]TBU72870.1 hypothetical protein DNK10_19490 [Pseudomonas daroniae]
MARGSTTTLPSNDGHPGLTITWAKDCRPAFNQSVRAAQAWLDNTGGGWLWSRLIAERELCQSAIEKRAFEVGFLSRIHQRLDVLKKSRPDSS